MIWLRKYVCHLITVSKAWLLNFVYFWKIVVKSRSKKHKNIKKPKEYFCMTERWPQKLDLGQNRNACVSFFSHGENLTTFPIAKYVSWVIVVLQLLQTEWVNSCFVYVIVFIVKLMSISRLISWLFKNIFIRIKLTEFIQLELIKLIGFFLENVTPCCLKIISIYQIESNHFKVHLFVTSWLIRLTQFTSKVDFFGYTNTIKDYRNQQKTNF